MLPQCRVEAVPSGLRFEPGRPAGARQAERGRHPGTERPDVEQLGHLAVPGLVHPFAEHAGQCVERRLRGVLGEGAVAADAGEHLP
jgi:hypothetical protein